MAIDDVYSVSNDFIYQGNPDSYIWYLSVTAEAVPAQITNALLGFGVARQTAFVPLHNPAVIFECVTVRQIFPNGSLPKQTLQDIAGDRTCDPVLAGLPGQCSCVVTLFGDSTNPTPNNRGRDFLTGQCCSDQFNGNWNSGPGQYLEQVCEMYRVMGNTFAAGGNVFSIGVFSPTRAGIAEFPHIPPTPPYFFPLQAVRARGLVRTQRRRQPISRCEEVCDAVIGAPVV